MRYYVCEKNGLNNSNRKMLSGCKNVSEFMGVDHMLRQFLVGNWKINTSHRNQHRAMIVGKPGEKTMEWPMRRI